MFQLAFVLLFHYICVSCSEVSLNSPSILLPFHFPNKIINYTLHTNKGCLIWKSFRPHAATVQPLTENNRFSEVDSCTPKALVSAVHKERERIFTVVQGKQLNGNPLLCDVEINSIKNISIVTSTKILYIGFPFTIFSIVAHDENDNTFTTLEGIPFQWLVLPDRQSKYPDYTGTHVLKIRKWSEIPNLPPDPIMELEKEGKQGSSVVISGINIGVAFVSSRITSNVYQDVPSTTVRIIVKDYLQLVPSYVIYILVGQTVYLKAFQLHHDITIPLQLPTDTYWLAMTDGKIASLSSPDSSVTGLQKGQTRVCVESIISDDGNGPCDDIIVTTPSYIQFSCIPNHDWMLETGMQYEISVHVFTEDNNEIYIETLSLETALIDDLILIDSMSSNGSHVTVTPHRLGKTTIKSKLLAIIGKSGLITLPASNQIKGLKDITVIDPVRVVPSVVAFPWIADSLFHYTSLVTAYGGSKTYKWSSGDRRIFDVNDGVVSSFGNKGIANGTVVDLHMPRHRAGFIVIVSDVIDIQAVYCNLEASIGSILYLPINLYVKDEFGSRYRVVDCTGIQFSVVFQDIGVFEYLSAQNEGPSSAEYGGCSSLAFKALKPAFVQVEIALKNTLLRTHVNLGAYRHLQIEFPPRRAILALGTSLVITAEGGPQPWLLDPSSFTIAAVSQNISIARSVNVPSLRKNSHSFQVSCLSYGDVLVTLTTENKKSTTNLCPKRDSISIDVTCGEPKSVYLVPELELPNLEMKCTLLEDPNSFKFPVLVDKPFNVNLNVKDVNGNLFHNFSSLDLMWSLQDHNNGRLIKSWFQNPLLDTPHMSAVQSMVIEKTVTVKLLLNIKQYRPHLMVGVSSVKAKLSSAINAVIEMYAVTPPRLSTSKLSLFNHPTNKAVVEIVGGSGYFFSSFKRQLEGEIAIVKLEGNSLHITPRLDGHQTIDVYDACINVSPPMNLLLSISDIGSIFVTVKNKIEVTKSTVLKVAIVDRTDSYIKSSLFSMLNLTPYLSGNGLSIEPNSQIDEYAAYYTLTGKIIGVYTLEFKATWENGEYISSAPQDIQVFEKLTLLPRQLTLIVGTVYQLELFGGPLPQVQVQYVSADEDIGVVNNTGHFNALQVGETRVTAKPTLTDYSVIQSEPSVDITVLPLDGLHIYVPTAYVSVGSEIPAFLTGHSSDINPFTFTSSLSNIEFDWSVDDSSVMSVLSHLHPVCDSSSKDRVSVMLKALRPGSVYVRVRAAGFYDSQILSAPLNIKDVKLHIYPAFSLSLPKTGMENHLRLTPSSSVFIKVTPEVTRRTISYHILDVSNLLITVNSQGLVTANSHDWLGSTVVYVTCTEDFGINRTIVVHVHVAHVHVLRINSALQFKESSLHAIPIGLPFGLTVSLHDEYVRQFHATNLRLQFQVNRKDFIQVVQDLSNTSLIVRPSAYGRTTLRVFAQINANHIVEDYVVLSVGTAISLKPSIPTVGSIQCLSLPFSTSDTAGEWNIEPSTAAVFFHNSVFFLTPGNRRISFTLSSGVSTFTDVTVKPLQKVELSPGKLKQVFVNVDQETTVFEFSVTFNAQLHSSDCEPDVSNVNAHLEWFRCNAWVNSAASSLNNIFAIESRFETAKGYLCVLTLKKTSSPALPEPSSTINIQVGIAHGLKSNVVSLPLVMPFVLASRTFVLSNLNPNAEVKIHGEENMLQNLQFESSNPAVSVLSSMRIVGNVGVVVIGITNTQFSQVTEGYITVRCPLTKFSDSIQVTVRQIQQTSPGEYYPSSPGSTLSNAYYLVATIASVVALIFGFIMLIFSISRKPITPITYSDVTMGDISRRMSDTRFGPPGQTPYPKLRTAALNRSNMSLSDHESYGSAQRARSHPSLWSQTSPVSHLGAAGDYLNASND